MVVFVSVIFGLWILATLLLKAPIVVTIPKFWYEGITLGWLVILKRESYCDKLIAHEFIHFKQQKETLVIFGYIMYFFEFIIKSIYYGSVNKGYRAISFEREAILMSGTPEYVFSRKPYMFRHFIFIEKIVTVTVGADDKQLSKLFAIGRAGVFKYEGEYSQVIKLINRNVPDGKKFRVKVVQVGTSLYNIYGDKTLVVLENTILPSN